MSTTKQLLNEVDALLVKTIRALKDAQQFRDSGFKPWKEEEAESYWREQIAQEIEDLACSDAHPSLQVQDACNIERYSYRRAANLARGK